MSLVVVGYTFLELVKNYLDSNCGLGKTKKTKITTTKKIYGMLLKEAL